MSGHILHDAPKKLDIINVSLRQRLVNTDGVEMPILEMGGSHTFLHPLKSFIAAANTVRLFLLRKRRLAAAATLLDSPMMCNGAQATRFQALQTPS